jgi:hypothetical protein
MTPQQFVKDRLAMLSAGAAGLGILLIVLAETMHQDWLKLFAAGLISVGGVGLGIEFGLADPRKWGFVEKIKAARLPVSYFIIAFTTLPVVVVLLAAFIGLFGDKGSTSAAGIAGGVMIVLFMTIATLLTVAMAVSSVQRAFRKSPGGADAEGTRDQPGEGDAS